MNDTKIKLSAAIIPSIGVGGILFNRNRQVLLIKRDQPPAQGLWSIPGGRQEPGESLVEACCREFEEETGLEVETKNIIAIVERRLEGFHYVIVDFLVVLKDENNAVPIARSDVAEAKWVDLSGLAQFSLVVGLEEIIKRSYASFIRSGNGGLQDAYATGSDFILDNSTSLAED